MFGFVCFMSHFRDRVKVRVPDEIFMPPLLFGRLNVFPQIKNRFHVL